MSDFALIDGSEDLSIVSDFELVTLDGASVMKKCLRCTFLNHGQSTICEICHAALVANPFKEVDYQLASNVQVREGQARQAKNQTEATAAMTLLGASHRVIDRLSGLSKATDATPGLSFSLSIIGVLILSVLATTTFQHITTLTHKLQFKEQEIEMHLEHAHALERRVQGLRSETVQMFNRIEELEHPAPIPEELNIQRKIFHLEHSQEQLHRGIQEQAKRLLVEKFGSGPKYYIKMKLTFDPDSNIVQDKTMEIEDSLWLETASVDEMPHTVHFFLEQISNGVYDNTQFYRNAPRFVQAGPGYSSEIAQQLEQDQPSLAHLLFQESSPSLIHQQYTLGYPGRPGGPDFYLNLQDNHDQHGVGAPHPHVHNNLMGSEDPCFARLIQGFSTLERIHRSNVLEEAEAARRPQHRMAHPVTIEYMRVHTEDKNTEKR